jgi:hypothetical protein
VNGELIGFVDGKSLTYVLEKELSKMFMWFAITCKAGYLVLVVAGCLVADLELTTIQVEYPHCKGIVNWWSSS